MMVDQNILKLEIKRLREMLNSKADEVFGLEKRRLQLETVLNFNLSMDYYPHKNLMSLITIKLKIKQTNYETIYQK